MKKSIASLELAALINELQFLIKAKIDQIYHQEKELLLQLHVPSKGKQLLKIISGKWLCLTKSKDAPEKPSGFCLQLRKYLDGAIVTALYQKDSERIVVFEFDKKEKYFLIVELFSKGNIVLTDGNMIVITALEAQEWKDRVIKPREKYVFPKTEIDYKTISKDKLLEILSKSEKRNLASSLATEIGIGGLYAEELCKLANINKDKSPKDVESNEITAIHKAIAQLFEKIKAPQGFIYVEEITPFALIGMESIKVINTYNEAIDTLILFAKASPFDKKIKSIERIVADQQESIKALEESISLNKKKGEVVYENYAQLQKMLEIVKEMRKAKDWAEIEKELNKVKKIVKVDLKNKKVVLELG